YFPLALVAALVQRRRPAVVIGVSVHPAAAVAGYVAARLSGARFLFEITDLWPQVLIDFGRIGAHGLTARVMRLLERFLYQRAERVLVVWRDTAAYFASQGLPPAKLAWVPHGVELERYTALPPYDGTLHRPFTLMYLGAFVDNNDLETLIQTAAEL